MSGNSRRYKQPSGMGQGGGGQYYTLTPMEAYLREKQLRKKGIPKDGCCLFRAVADQVYLTQTTHWDLRRLCANYISQNPTKFQSFMTISLEDYCWRLANCNLWGGEMELVALSELLGRVIDVHHELDGKVDIKTFSPKGKNSGKPKVMLLFSGNNHYDSLWKSKEESAAACCQSILYELLLESVMKCKMDSRDVSKAIKMRGYDFGSRYASTSYFVDRYSDDVLRGLSCSSFFNIPYRVFRRDKEACEKADRRLAVSLQFTIGDQCRVLYNGSQYTGDILSGITTGNMIEVFVKDIKKRIKVPFSDVHLQSSQKQRSRYNKGSGSVRGGNKSNNSNGDIIANSTPKRSYSKNGKMASKKQHHHHHQQQQQETPTPISVAKQPSPEQQEPLIASPSAIITASTSSPAAAQQYKPSLDTAFPPTDLISNTEDTSNLLDNQQEMMQQQSLGFSEATVRMSSLMGRPLEIFNQSSLASINEAPESEWPILNAGASTRSRLTTVMAGSNPQRCHLDGPPPPMAVDHLHVPFVVNGPITNPIVSTNDVKLLLRELDPPFQLLKTGSIEEKQQFMFQFAQNCLRFYSKYMPESELEDSLHELLYMEFEDFISPSAVQRDLSVMSSGDGSQMGDVAVSDHSEDIQPTNQQQEPDTSHVTETTPPTEPILSPNNATVKEVNDGPSPSLEPANEGNIATPMVNNPFPHAAPFMYPPPPHSPYGYPAPPYPYVLPSHMIPWPFYHPMANPYLMANNPAAIGNPPHTVRPQSLPDSEEDEVVSNDNDDGDSSDSNNRIEGKSKQPATAEVERLVVTEEVQGSGDVKDDVIVKKSEGGAKEETVQLATGGTVNSSKKNNKEEGKKIPTVKKQDGSTTEDKKKNQHAKTSKETVTVVTASSSNSSVQSTSSQQPRRQHNYSSRHHHHHYYRNNTHYSNNRTKQQQGDRKQQHVDKKASSDKDQRIVGVNNQ